MSDKKGLIPKIRLTRRSFLKHGFRFSVLALLGFGFTSRNNLKTEYVAIPYLSHHFIPIKNSARYLAGLVKEPYGYTYVNRGIGTLVFPFRIGAPPEITSIKLIRV